MENTKISAQANDNLNINLNFSAPVAGYKSFVIQYPHPSLVIDFTNVRDATNRPSIPIDIGIVNNMNIVEASNRMRIVFNLKQAITKKGYKVLKSANGRIVTVAINGTITNSVNRKQYVSTANRSSPYRIKAIDFRRGENGGGQIVVNVSSPNINVDIEEKGNVLLFHFLKTTLSKQIARRLDVTDFSTPVQFITMQPQLQSTVLEVQVHGMNQHISYQFGNNFIIDVKPINQQQAEVLKQKNQTFTGKRISLNFQDIKIRAVLQLLAEFTGLNIIASDSVKGNITLRMNDVPWDQVMDIILKTHGLDKRQVGNVILIAPTAELAANETQQLSNKQQVQSLAPLQSILVQLNYSVASDMEKLLRNQSATVLSSRGSVLADARTNTLLIHDTADKLLEAREFLEQLDRPVRQVIVKARIVNIQTDYLKELGVNFGITRGKLTGSVAGSNIEQGGTAGSTSSSSSSSTSSTSSSGGPILIPLNQRLNVNLPAANVGSLDGPGAIGVALARLGGDAFLDLELSALESENKSEIIASPTLVTSSQQAANIQQGVEIPYQTSSANGGTTVAFKSAVLSLSVTPQITPDNKLILDLKISQDTPGEVVLGTPSINTRKIETKVLVNNGETIVLGGIYSQQLQKQVRRVPFFGNLPVVGKLFRHETNIDKKAELLIFITPKIIKQQLRAIQG